MIETRRFRIKVGLLGIVVILWLVTFTQSAILLYSHPKTEPSHFAAVQANLRQISAALSVYRNENNDVFPPRLSMLYPYYISDPAAFWNPGDSDPRPTTLDNDEPNGINSTQVSFQYLAGVNGSQRAFVVLQDNTLSNNDGIGIHALDSYYRVHFFRPSETPLSHTATAVSNLEEIGAALQNYADANGGHYPAAFSALYPAYISDPLIFWNPGDTLPDDPLPPTTINNDQPNAADSAQISYAYSGAGYTTASDPGVILVQDNSTLNNGGAMLNIMTADMNVATYIPDVDCDSASSCRALALNNLRSISVALYTYANENADSLPPNLSRLIEMGGLFDPTTFWNPGDTDPRPLIINNDALNQANSTQISYAYFGGSSIFVPDVVANDNTLANNNSEGLLVLTSDGVAEFFEKSDRTHPSIENSKANLRQIGMALHAYADGHGGQFPAMLSLLYPGYISDPTVFWSPGDRDPFPATINNDAPNMLDSAQVSYHYLGAAYNSACPAGTVLVEDNSLVNNFGSGMNVLTADGNADFYVPQAPKCSPSSACESIAFNNLRVMLHALYVYTNENQGILPATLSELYPYYIARPRDFWHPRDRDPWPLTINNDVLNQENSAQISFTYLAAGQNINILPRSAPLVRENAPSGGGNQVLELRAWGDMVYVKK